MKHERINIDLLLKKAMRSMETPDPELVQKVIDRQLKEEYPVNNTVVKRSFGLVAALVTLLLVSTTALAAWLLLKPSEVAEMFDDRSLSAAFESDTAIHINSSETSGGYTFTLLAIVSGTDLSDHPINSNGEIKRGGTYAVTAIQRADGASMQEASDEFYVSPYIKSLEPWQINAHTMGGGYSEIIVEGVLYRILNCDDITMFADRGAYLGINSGSFYNAEAFLYNKQTGELKANPSFDGASVVFELPLDKALADPEKAQKFLDSLEEEGETSGDGPSVSDAMRENGAVKNTYTAMTYEQYKAWMEARLAETQAMVDRGEYTKAAMNLDRRDYEANLQEIQNGAVLTLTEYEDGAISVMLTYPNDDFTIREEGGGVVIRDK